MGINEQQTLIKHTHLPPLTQDTQIRTTHILHTPPTLTHVYIPQIHTTHTHQTPLHTTECPAAFLQQERENMS